MFSKETSRKLREHFWISFGKSFPRKWILYDTKIKGLALKFHFDLEKAIVALDIEGDLEERINNWEKLISVKSILLADYLPSAIFEDTYVLENQKEISRMYIEKPNVCIHDKNTWRDTMVFFNEHMQKLEEFFTDYETVLR